MTRIIAGRAGGRRLSTPPGTATRPTSDRVREALFSAVESWCGSLAGLRVLDLYAGSGAVGLEAWSRGAAAVTLVESDRRTAALVTANAREIGAGEAQVVTGAVASVLARPPAAAYDVVFADPPYPLSDEAVADDLRALVAHGWLAPDALVVVERSARSPEPAWPEGLEPHRRRAYGETVLWYGHAAPPPEAEAPQSSDSHHQPEGE
ncbi:16S rRNA (guanine(966)-N(2))-methyltransferase RsmD [Nocardioides sp. zg-DK7169]|uniref:16S rRNA (guanine(966)-N(2))-methyltransferase RsmD n=1 Tax=Nocardioides sp. zg-DK7169 TaxID=2736600 RepID=UPI001551BAE5|nr:16S rRNA (guanine(966)-N(2))-methyltransferase RsmD [Nocardioides sp. zg-DK7169]NPC95576.1 16S rRNA (guanine(966)-N(2))-methyltransferase RsmD [Nocardioides sp. zg-DK7169]